VAIKSSAMLIEAMVTFIFLTTISLQGSRYVNIMGDETLQHLFFGGGGVTWNCTTQSIHTGVEKFCFWSKNNIIFGTYVTVQKEKNLSQGRQTTLYTEQTKISYQNK